MKSMSRFLNLLLFVLGLVSCLPAAAWSAQQGLVVILLSSNVPAYQEPARDFELEYDGPVRVFTLHGTTREVPIVLAEVLAAKPRLILALGARAAYAAKMWTEKEQQIPVLFAQAMNWRHFGLLGKQANIAGIDMVSPAGSELAYLTMFAPDVRRIGMVYSKGSEAMARKIQEAAGLFGLEVVMVAAQDSRDLKFAYKALVDEIDGFIVLRDPKVYDLDNMEWLGERCRIDKIVCLGRSAELAQKGTLLTVSPGSRDIALQAVSLTQAILSGQTTPQEIGVAAPLGTRVVLSLEAATALNLTISQEVQDAATEVIW